MTYTLSDDVLSVAFDEHGKLLSLTNRECTGENVIVEPPRFAFKLATELGECKENMAYDENQLPEVVSDKHSLTFLYHGLQTFDGSRQRQLDIDVTLTVTLQEGRLVFGANLENRSPARLLDFAYPTIGKIRSLGEGRAAGLLYPQQCGYRYQNIGRYLGYAHYNRENGSNSISGIYPGSISMSWMALSDDERTLSMRSEDKDFFPTELRVQGERWKDSVTLWTSRFVCLESGQSRKLADTVVEFYKGDWHQAAVAYSRWLAPLRPRHERPAWVTGMKGYFLVINKQQFGYEMWPYATLPELYRLAQSHGFDTLGLFGWYQSGHDNQYPDLQVSSTMGGEEALKAGIREVQAQGGHVTLYYQGHLIDETSSFYRNGEGPQVAMKNIWGSPYVEFYNKSHENDFLKEFSRKMFTLACPSSSIWQNLMRDREDWLASFGPNGCLYDQIGGMVPYVCFGKGHDHAQDCPALATSNGRVKLLGTLQRHSKEINPEFAFMSEHIVDLYSGYLDMVHGILTSPGGEGSYAAAKENPDRPCQLNYPALFRYCFPETIITVRNSAPYLEPRLMNYALLFGFMPEMEIRYAADCADVKRDAFKAWREYACKVVNLRERYRELLKLGTYCDQSQLVSCPKGIMSGSFLAGERLAVVLWNDTTKDQSLQHVTVVPGWSLKECATVDGVLPQRPDELLAGAVLVMIYGRD